MIEERTGATETDPAAHILSEKIHTYTAEKVRYTVFSHRSKLWEIGEENVLDSAYNLDQYRDSQRERARGPSESEECLARMCVVVVQSVRFCLPMCMPFC